MFSRKIFCQCLTFGAVYTIAKSIYVFSIEGSEYIQFLAHLSRKAHGELIVYQSSRRLCVCQCVHTFKHEYL